MENFRNALIKINKKFRILAPNKKRMNILKSKIQFQISFLNTR